MSVYIGDVQTFAGVIADKPQVLKIGEETMEVFSAWEDYKYAPEFRKDALIAEIADVIQAACNLLTAIGVEDMRQPMQECYVRNSERGRKYANDTFSAENDVTAQSVDANDANADSHDHELQEALNAAAGKWAKADAENRELQAENEGLKARIESLRSKLSKMLDVASAIQHIGDLP